MENNDIDMDLENILLKEREIEHEYQKKLKLYESSILLAEAEGKSIDDITKSIKKLGEEKTKELESFAKRKEILTKREDLNQRAINLESDIQKAKDAKSIKEENEWAEKRKDAMVALHDPAEWMKSFLMKKAAEKEKMLRKDVEK